MIAEGCGRWATSPNHVRPVLDQDASNARHDGMMPAKSIRSTFLGKFEALCHRCNGSGEVPLDPKTIPEKKPEYDADLTD